MGLSNEERVAGVYHAINNIVNLARNIPDEDDYKYLKEYVDGLWPAAIGAQSNPIHWLMGSASSNVLSPEAMDTFSVAMLSHFPRIIDGKAETTIENDDKDDFNPFDGFLDMEGLLRQDESDRELANVYSIQLWVEQMIYKLRRYNDEFLNDRKDLSCLVTKIQGEIFNIIDKEPQFARAYILSRICVLIYGGRYGIHNKDDKVNKWLLDSCIHHDLSAPMTRWQPDVNELAEIHVHLMADGSPQNRVMTALKVAGRRFHEDYSFAKLTKALPDLDHQALKQQFDICKKLYEEDKKASPDEYQERNQEHFIYGYHDVLPVKKE